jgi:hypothetical protein
MSRVCLALSLAVPALASAAEPAAPKVTISGVLFAHYGVDLTEGAELANGFDLDRTYLKTDAKLSDALAVRLTLDSNRQSAQTVVLPTGEELEVPADSRLRVFVKHAWLAWKPNEDVEVRAGMVDTPLLPFLEKYQDLRWTARAFLDDQKVASTTDLGVSLAGKHTRGTVSWGAGVYNGEFFSTPETGSGKSFQARVTVDPLVAGEDELQLPITAFVDQELYEGGVPSSLVWAADAGFVHPNLMLSAQVAGRSQDGVSGLGQSGQISPRVEDVGFLFGRVDRWDPDTATDGDANLKVIGGVARELAEGVLVGVQYERATTEAAPDEPIHGAFVRLQAAF